MASKMAFEDTKSASESGGVHDKAAQELSVLGYTQQLGRNRSWLTMLSQSLTISCIPYAIGAPIITAIYGGGQLPLFIGWIVVTILSQCVALSLAELTSRFPTSAGPYYWVHQLSPPKYKQILSFAGGWVWLIANWTVASSAFFGTGTFLCSIITLYIPEWTATDWQLILISWAVLVSSLLISLFFNRWLPVIDSFMAILIGTTILITCIALSVEAKDGRNSAKQTLVGYDDTLSGWGGFSFFIGLLPAAYTFSAIGMVSSMAEEVEDVTTELPRAIAWMVPISFVLGFFFIIPICATLPPLAGLLEAPYGQALPVIFSRVLGSSKFGGALSVLIFITVFGACICMHTVVARCTWAFARDEALPASSILKRVSSRTENPFNAFVFTSTLEALLMLIYLGNATAFTALISVAVIGLQVAYLIPIIISVLHGRREVNNARWNCGPVFGLIANLLAIVWVLFELILFSMPTYIPTTPETMNYAIVVFFGFLSISVVWYIVHARKVYKGPPESDGIAVTY